MSNRLSFTETFALQGRPENELLVTNEHLLSSTLLLISLGTKAGDKFSQNEHTLLQRYVENGGRLLLTTCSPETPPNQILDPFGVTFERDVIKDAVHHAGRHNDHILVKDLADHPINNGVTTIRFGNYGCYPLQIHNPEAITRASSSEHAEPPKAPVAALVPYGAGQVVVIGQTRLFQDDFINEVDNQQWFENIFTFLTSTPTQPQTQENQGIISTPNFCPKCGITRAEGALFCSNCGAKVTS